MLSARSGVTTTGDPVGGRYGDAIARAAILSFRLGGSDGVAVEAAKWQHALGSLGFSVVTVAGDGPVDRLLPGLAIGAEAAPERSEVAEALDDVDLVVVENLCSLPLNPAAASVVARVLAGRPAVLHHHDLPWQRHQYADRPPPPVDDHWSQVTINELSRRQLAERGIAAATVYNTFDTRVDGTAGRADAASDPDPGPRSRRAAVRRALGVEATTRLVLQPTRAIPRKNVAGGMAVAAELGATFWLLGPAEDGYGPELDRLVAGAPCPVLLGVPNGVAAFGVVDAYRACDVVALPSTWEGFGNPTIESVVHRRPLAIGPYPVAAELASFGFEWFPLDGIGRLDAWLRAPDSSLLDRNLAVAAAHFDQRDLPGRIEAVLPDW